MRLRKPEQSLNPRFVAWPLELGLGTHNPRFVAWPLELGLGTLNPRFVVWHLELGLGTHNPCFVAWPLELGLGTHNPRFVAWPLELGLGTLNPRFVAWPNLNPNLNANLSLRKATPSRSPTLLNHPPPKESTQRKSVRGRTKRQRMRFWSILSPFLRICTPLHPIYDDGNGGGVQWWVKRCKSTCVRTQVARMGANAETLEEFWMKYGHPELLDRDSLFRFFFWMKHTPPAESGAFMSNTECSEVAWR